MGLVHAVLLGIMWYADIKPLLYFNILSVIVYFFCILLCHYGIIMPVYISIFTEVSLYAATSVYFIGWDCGSPYFLFAIIPILIYFGSYLFKGNQRWIIVILISITLALFAFLYLRRGQMVPVFLVAPIVKAILMLFTTFSMAISVIFYNVIYIYSSEYELNRLEEENDQLSAESKEDTLTHLLNRRGFMPIITEIANRSNEATFSVAFCDIDNFKRINDSYGHDCGDEVLRHITKIIVGMMQGCEVCRWGGEEIIILMRGYDLTTAKNKLEDIRKTIENSPTTFYNKRISATLTIGVEEYSDSYQDVEDLIKVADERMYYGKQHGKNIVIDK
jgi:diguanylate cyclase (GGDEF)-like protein